MFTVYKTCGVEPRDLHGATPPARKTLIGDVCDYCTLLFSVENCKDKCIPST